MSSPNQGVIHTEFWQPYENMVGGRGAEGMKEHTKNLRVFQLAIFYRWQDPLIWHPLDFQT